MRYICSLLFVWFAIASTAVAAAATQREHPNIVLIYADDLGYGDLQCYNPRRGKIPTPHVDRLADEGMRFTDAHSSSAVCSPSRYTLLTGRYHWRTRLQSGIVGRWGKPLIAADRLTLGKLARQNGYRTACIGKWHLGWDWPIPDDQRRLFNAPGDWRKKGTAVTETQRIAWRNAFSQPIAGGPISRGFDEYFGTDVPNWPPYCFIENDRTVGIPSEYAAPRCFRRTRRVCKAPPWRTGRWNRCCPQYEIAPSPSFDAKPKHRHPSCSISHSPLHTPRSPSTSNGKERVSLASTATWSWKLMPWSDGSWPP